jgi:hypothetical protein
MPYYDYVIIWERHTVANQDMYPSPKLSILINAGSIKAGIKTGKNEKERRKGERRVDKKGP